MISRSLQNSFFYYGLLLLAISLPLSKSLFTIVSALILINWVIDAELWHKIKSFFSDRIAIAFSLVYFVHLIWLINTSDFQFAFFDLGLKIYIFVFAIVFSTSPYVSPKEFRNVLLVHSLSVFVVTITGFIHFKLLDTAEFRTMSPFISHIRLAMNVCIAVFTLLYYSVHKADHFQSNTKARKFLPFVFALMIIWLIFFLTKMQSLTGLILIGIVFFILLLKYLFRRIASSFIRILVIAIVIAAPLFISFYIVSIFRDYMHRPAVDFGELDKLTSRGNEYTHDTTFHIHENGKWTGLYLCEEELRHAWNQRSGIAYDSLSETGFPVGSALIRYLTSLDLRKDHDGVYALNEEDVAAISRGIATVENARGSALEKRIHTVFFELNMYKTRGQIAGSSILQRYDLWKNAISLIKDNFLTGTGTGDLKSDFERQLAESGSPLSATALRMHNQYFSFFAAFGILGFLICIFSLIYPFIARGLYKDYFGLIFLIVFLLSFIPESTLETLAGAGFYSFFGALFLFQKRHDHRI